MKLLMQSIRALFARLGLKAANRAAAGPPARLSAPPELMSESERDGLVNTVFFVRSYHRNADGSQQLELAATFERRPVGLTVVLGSSWAAGSAGADILHPTYQGTVTLKSAGASGNNFVHCLARLYRAERMVRHMKNSIDFAATALSGHPGKLTAEPVTLKLFHDSGKADGVAEFLLNLDLPAHRAHLDEKDEDFRKPVIAALSE